MTFEDCKRKVAQKYELGTTLVTGHRDKYWTEAAEMYSLLKSKEAADKAWDAGSDAGLWNDAGFRAEKETFIKELFKDQKS